MISFSFIIEKCCCCCCCCRLSSYCISRPKLFLYILFVLLSSSVERSVFDPILIIVLLFKTFSCKNSCSRYNKYFYFKVVLLLSSSRYRFIIGYNTLNLLNLLGRVETRRRNKNDKRGRQIKIHSKRVFLCDHLSTR